MTPKSTPRRQNKRSATESSRDQTNAKLLAKRRHNVLSQACPNPHDKRSKPVDALLITDPHDIRYLSGLHEGSSGLLVLPKGKATLLTNKMYEHVAPVQAPGCDVVIGPKGGDAVLKTLLRGTGFRKLGYQQDKISLARFQSICEHLPAGKLVGLSGVTDQARAVKDETELKLIKKCVKIAEDAFLALFAEGKAGIVGRTEQSIAAELEFRMREMGADRQGFSPNNIIVASGPNSASCHHVPSKRKVKANDILLIDWGAEIDGYRSDTTRTLTIGKGIKQVNEVFDVVEAALKQSTAALIGGVSSLAVDGISRQVIGDAGLGERFIHGLGHSLGLQIHEPPFMGRVDVPILTGTVMTVEPGVYFDGVGGVRLENDVLVTTTGPKVLNKLPTDRASLTLA